MGLKAQGSGESVTPSPLKQNAPAMEVPAEKPLGGRFAIIQRLLSMH